MGHIVKMQLKTSKEYTDCKLKLISILEVQDFDNVNLPVFKTDFNIVEIKNYLLKLEEFYNIELNIKIEKERQEELNRRKLEEEKKRKEAEELEKLKALKELESRKNECEVMH